VDKICAALSALRIPVAPEERQLHGMIAAALREAALTRGTRRRSPRAAASIFWPATWAIEVKRGRQSAARLRAQAARYLLRRTLPR
jgi:hypothetical protein